MAQADTQKREIAFQLETTPEGPCAHALAVQIGADEVDRAFSRAYRDLGRSARVRGFRPGKAPRSVLEKLYGPSLGEQLEQTLVGETLPRALEQSGLKVVTEPAVEAQPPEPGADFHYVARVEVKPEVSLPDLSGLPARRPAAGVGEDEVDRELESLRQKHAPVLEEPEGTPAASGHILSLDFVGRIDGEPFEGGTGRGVELELGAGGFIPGFEDALVGACAGEDREVRVVFPDDYGNADLAGKPAEFAVHVAEVKRRRVPELDDEFAKDLGDFDSIEALRERVRADLTAMRERSARQELRRTLLDSLIERAPFEVPPGLVERALSRQISAAHRRLEGSVPHDALHDQLARWKEEWRGGAEREVRETLLLEAVAEAEKLEVSDQEIQARLAEMAQEQDLTPARMLQALGEDALRGALRGQLLEDKALEFLISEAKVEETTDS